MSHLFGVLFFSCLLIGAPPADDDLAAKIAAAGDASKYPSADCVVVFDDSMVEVAVVSLVAALSDDEVAAVKARGPITGAALTAQYDIEADTDG